jgi:squalene-hopene/tetraprenyl-beta-curcumene cyclase
VDKGLAYLLSIQREDGGIYVDQLATYNTSIAVQALTAAGRPEHKAAIGKAVAFLRRAQYGDEAGVPGMVVPRSDQRYGGMGYGDNPSQPDMSNTHFALDSLRAAGVPESDPAFQRALAYAQRLQNRRENESGEGEPKEWKAEDGSVIVRSNDGGSVYRPGQSKAGTLDRPDGKKELRSYGSMTYALLKCYLFAGLPKDDPRVADAVKWIRSNYTWRANPGFPESGKGEALQGLYYYYATGARALALLGDDAAGSGPDGKPRRWKDDLGAILLGAQNPDGSWVNSNDHWMEGMPLVATCFALQALAETVR